MSTQKHLDNYITFTDSGKLFQSVTLGSSVRVANTPNDLLTFLGIAQGLNYRIPSYIMRYWSS